jgi:hypothetical protein
MGDLEVGATYAGEGDGDPDLTGGRLRRLVGTGLEASATVVIDCQ